MIGDPFARADPTDDADFYSMPRKVVHIEVGAIESLRAWYGEILPSGGRVLDLMSSWRSHLPDGLGPVTGLGMNADEMADNPQLERWVVHDLNRQPRTPFDDGSFDAAVCTVSIQYLTDPVAVLSDLRRVVAPGGPVAFAFSNRCFPTKAVRRWLYATDADHVAMVRADFGVAGFPEPADLRLASPDDPVFVVWAPSPSP